MGLIADHYSIITYMLVVIGMGLIIFGLAVWAGLIWFFGDAAKKYFQARIKFDNTIALLNIFDLNYNITLSYAKQLTGGVFENLEKLGEKVLPKSTYSINGVTNVLAFDVHPKLHEDLVHGLKLLQKMGCHTLDQLKEVAEGEDRERVLFTVPGNSSILGKMFKKIINAPEKAYTYKSFYELLLKTKQKYEITVTIDDVINFINKSFNKHHRKSIEAKLINVQIKQKMDDKYTKYAFLIIGIIIIGLMIIMVYKKLHPVAGTV